MRERPLLGVRVSGQPPRGFTALVAALEAWSRPQADHDQQPDAWLVSSSDLAPSDGCPCAVAPPCGTVDASSIPWIAPFVSWRWRVFLGLPDVVVVGPNHPDALDARLASAAAVRGDDLLYFMAAGVPCVTDASSAAAVGARDGRAVVVGEPDELTALATELASDLDRATPISREARRLVERAHDASAVARRLACELGLMDRSSAARSLLHDRLDELGAASESQLTARALAAIE
jgi:hypothetical protein